MPSALIKDTTVRQVFDDAYPIPSPLHLEAKLQVSGATVGWSGSEAAAGYAIVPATYTDTQPKPTSYTTGQTYTIVNNAVQVTRTWVTPPTAPLSLKFLEFIALFTQAEQAAIVASTDVQVRLFLLMAAAASEVILSDPKTEAGVNYLVSLGLLTSQRAAQILSGTPTTS